MPWLVLNVLLQLRFLHLIFIFSSSICLHKSDSIVFFNQNVLSASCNDLGLNAKMLHFVSGCYQWRNNEKAICQEMELRRREVVN
jgi:hypothetical protein